MTRFGAGICIDTRSDKPNDNGNGIDTVNRG